MLDSLSMEDSALAITKPSSGSRGAAKTKGGRSDQPRPPSNKSNLWCNYCNKLRHTKEN